MAEDSGHSNNRVAHATPQAEVTAGPEKRMSKFAKIVITLVVIGLVFNFVTASVYTQKMAAEKEASLKSYYTRKDTVLSEQRRLESLIVELNNTLQYEVYRYEVIADALNKLEKRNATASVIKPKIPPQQVTLPKPVTVTPITKPKPAPRVTRAS